MTDMQAGDTVRIVKGFITGGEGGPTTTGMIGTVINPKAGDDPSYGYEWMTVQLPGYLHPFFFLTKNVEKVEKVEKEGK